MQILLLDKAAPAHTHAEDCWKKCAHSPLTMKLPASASSKSWLGTAKARGSLLMTELQFRRPRALSGIMTKASLLPACDSPASPACCIPCGRCCQLPPANTTSSSKRCHIIYYRQKPLVKLFYTVGHIEKSPLLLPLIKPLFLTKALFRGEQTELFSVTFATVRTQNN